MSEQKTTPLIGYYQETGAKLIDFGGYLLPVQLSSITEEHQAVRHAAGIFDVSHMGEFFLTGAGAADFLQRMMTNDLSRVAPGEACYTAMCYEDGGTVDDLLIYRLAEERFMLVVNAANINKDFDWLRDHLTEEDGLLEDRSETMALLAVQGPLAERIVQKLTETDLRLIDGFTFKQNVQLAGTAVLLSRTGYTGEDGFELYCQAGSARHLWDAILQAGTNEGICPCGLGARDTLRFEARLPLYGHELSRDISPLEAGIGFAVKLSKSADFIGKAALARQKSDGLKRRLVGIEMVDRAIPRAAYEVSVDDQPIGFITTGTHSPTLGKNLGLALIDAAFTAAGTTVDVTVRGKKKRAIVIKTPFYRRRK
ncbi:MAG: glycine cleavage system aminomethyltransferase GcvT [Sporolactobacillus sp.]